jgi:hypothetical protein
MLFDVIDHCTEKRDKTSSKDLPKKEKRRSNPKP